MAKDLSSFPALKQYANKAINAFNEEEQDIVLYIQSHGEGYYRLIQKKGGAFVQADQAFVIEEENYTEYFGVLTVAGKDGEEYDVHYAYYYP